jgi:hypothetical protein|tara:strand:- start:1614 stop:1874 length:261 start_codon:yes stop_codon:yes gene_type:complete
MSAFLILIAYYWLIIFSKIGNVFRVNKEYNVYKYNILNNTFYWNQQQNFKIYKRVKNLRQYFIEEDKLAYLDHIKVKFLNNSYIYY